MSDEDAVYRWRVLRRADLAAALDGLTTPPVDLQGETYWQELGSLGSRYSSLPPDADEVGALGGAGEYLLLREGVDNYYLTQFELEGRTAYSKVQPVEPAEDIRPESLRVGEPA